MRIHHVATTALAIGLPAFPAGPAHVAALNVASVPKPVLSKTTLARRISPAAAASAESAATANAPANGSLTLEARQLPQAEAIAVAGNAPAGSQVTLTLLATISRDIPTIVVSRHYVTADGAGRYQAVIPIASAFARGTLLNVIATSESGTTPAQAQLTVGAPNEGVTVPLESPL